MKNLVLIFLVLCTSAFADVNAMLGVSVSTSSTIMGRSSLSGVMGQTLASAGGGAIALVSNGSAASSDGQSVTSSSFNSTGANSIIGVVAYQDFGAGNPTISDNKGNSYLTRTVYSTGGLRIFVFYAQNLSGGSIGSGHTVTATGGTFTSPAIIACAFSNVNATAYDGVEAGTFGFGTSGSTGTMTPSQNDCLIVAGINANALAETITATGTGFTKVAQVNATGNSVAVAMSYEIQTTATAKDPGFSWSTSQSSILGGAVFRN